jgi:hypothetical protein
MSLVLRHVVLLSEVGDLSAIDGVLFGLQVGDEMVHATEPCSVDGTRTQVDVTEVFGNSREVMSLVLMAGEVPQAAVGVEAGWTDVYIGER